MTYYCDYYLCQNLATHTYLNGLLRLCNTHNQYYNYLKPRMLNLKMNCGRRNGETNYLKKIL